MIFSGFISTLFGVIAAPHRGAVGSPFRKKRF